MPYPDSCCGQKAAEPKAVLAWEQLNGDFERANERLEKTISSLAEKVTPLIVQRTCGEENCKPSPEREYNSSVFQAFHQRLITQRALIDKLDSLINALEI